MKCKRVIWLPWNLVHRKMDRGTKYGCNTLNGHKVIKQLFIKATQYAVMPAG